MTSAVYDPHQFNLQTKTFEQQAYESAITKARDLARNGADIKVHRLSGKICDEAFGVFKKNMQAAFPSVTYKNLISLTLTSRENLFFIDLKERVITIFRNPDG